MTSILDTLEDYIAPLTAYSLEEKYELEIEVPEDEEDKKNYEYVNNGWQEKLRPSSIAEYLADETIERQNVGRRRGINFTPLEEENVPVERSVPSKIPVSDSRPLKINQETFAPRATQEEDTVLSSVIFEADRLLPSLATLLAPQVQQGNTQTQAPVIPEYVLTTERTALEKTYGCMLHSPVTDTPVLYKICKPIPPEKSRAENSIEFFEWLFDNVTDFSVEKTISKVCSFSLLFFPTNFAIANPLLTSTIILGCDFVASTIGNWVASSENAKQSVSGVGSVNVKYIECEDNTTESFELTQPYLDSFSPPSSECFVPIRNFRDNEPEQLGMKRQLQVTYEFREEILDDAGQPTGEFETYKKQITIPSPKNVGDNQTDMSIQDIKDAFPEELSFGEIKAEMDIIPYGHIRFYASAEDYNNGSQGNAVDNFFDDILDLIVDGEEKPNSRRFSKRTRQHKTGTFKRKKAFLFEWNVQGQPPLCAVYDLT